MKFSLIHPSRSRPEKSFNTIERWLKRADNFPIRLIVSVDEDDPELSGYMNLYPNDVLEINKNRSAVDAVNNAAKYAMVFDDSNVMIVVSDDTDCPMHWDKILTDAIGNSKDFVMKTWDGIQKRIITMPIMDRIYFNRDRYIYNPIYDHSWCDTELTEVAHSRGRVIKRMDIHFPHDHYSVLKQEPDDLYKRNDLTHDRDRHIYENRKRINFGL